MDLDKFFNDTPIMKKPTIDIEAFVSQACRGFSVDYEQVIDCYLSIEDEHDIRHRALPIEVFKIGLQLWIESGCRNISGKPSGYKRQYLRDSQERQQVRCEYCTKLTNNGHCTARKHLPQAAMWVRCKDYEYSGFYRNVVGGSRESLANESDVRDMDPS